LKEVVRYREEKEEEEEKDDKEKKKKERMRRKNITRMTSRKGMQEKNSKLSIIKEILLTRTGEDILYLQHLGIKTQSNLCFRKRSQGESENVSNDQFTEGMEYKKSSRK
jgi:hypothetical protein